MTDSIFPEDADRYAMKIADESFAWYRSRAIRSRKFHKTVDTATVITSAAIPVSGLIADDSGPLVPSLIGALVFVLVGLRSTFHWQDNFLRFSQAREAVEAERRKFLVGANPYDDPSLRAELLVFRITAIEQQEMGTWLKTAAGRATNEQLGTHATSPPNTTGE